jgi:isoleucyl-tRNA synthetase
VDSLSNWYVRRSRRRFWKSENDADKLSAYNTLYQCLVTLSKLLAPFTPFLADELYQNLVLTAFPDAPESVHLADFPVADETRIDQQLSADIQLAMRVASLGRAARSQAGIKVRQPLAEVVVRVNSMREKEGLERVKSQVLDELNVKDLKLIADMNTLDKGSYSITSEGNYWVAVPTKLSPELEAEGMAREVVHRLQTMRRSANFEIADHIVIYYQGDEHIRKVMTEFADYIRQETLAEQLLEQVPEPGAFTESHKLGEHKVSLSVKRLD